MTTQKAAYLIVGFIVVFRVLTFSYDYPQDVPVQITGRVVQDPIVFENKRQVVIHGIRAYLDLYPEVVYGDLVVLEGEIQDQVLREAKLVEVKSGGGLYEIRERIISGFERSLPQPHSALVSGIVLGSKSGMPDDFWEKLKFTGTAHVVVASGMNVTFVISFLLNFLISFMKRQKAILISVSGAWIYVLLSGFDAPLIRAAVMGSIAFSAQAMGRVSSAISALFISAAFMLIVRPEWFFDLGFILSFTATLSLIIFEPKVSRLLSKVPLILKKDLATTIAAQIGVTPILLVSFGSVNIFSPFINALVLWTIPPIMVTGAIASVIGLAVPKLGEVVVMLALPFTFWFVKVIELLSYA